MNHVIEVIGENDKQDVIPFDVVALDHDGRHLRRKVLTLQHGDQVLVDFSSARQLAHGDRLVLADGRHVEVVATDEDLMEVTATKAISLTTLAWHIGNRHLPAQIEAERILVQHDHVIQDMLKVLGAELREVREPFQPERGAYHNHGTTGENGAHGHHHHSHG